MDKNTSFNVGIYTRISVEEKVKSLADSIANQKIILSEYAINKGFNITRIYEDEGESGGSYNRPEFKLMLEDIENDIINCVLVKDLSRLGREYIETGEYIEKYFPEHNIRFISIFENIDSFENPERMNDIDIPIMNIFNEDYLKRTSKSTKSILDIKRRDGEFVGAYTPYGYVRSKTRKNHLEVDEEVKDNVIRIFDLYLKYNSIIKIVDAFNQEGILSPTGRRKQLRGEEPNESYTWNDNSIRAILRQEIYTGDMVQGKTKSYSYKVKKRIPLPREQWTIVPNTHEAIIDKETFKTVQQMMRLKSKPTTKKHKTKSSVLSGLLVCKECDKKMQRTIVSKNNIDYYYYSCANYKNLGKKACCSQPILENVVIDTIIVTLNTIIDNMIDIENAIKRKNLNIVEKETQKIKVDIKTTSNELAKYKKAKTCLYNDYVNGEISSPDYKYMKDEFCDKCSKLETKKERLKQELYDHENGRISNNEVFKTYIKYQGIDKLTRRIAVALIDKIVIDREHNMRIVFKFKDEIKKYQYNL